MTITVPDNVKPGMTLQVRCFSQDTHLALLTAQPFPIQIPIT